VIEPTIMWSSGRESMQMQGLERGSKSGVENDYYNTTVYTSRGRVSAVNKPCS
jgi:hypothetical protein